MDLMQLTSASLTTVYYCWFQLTGTGVCMVRRRVYDPILSGLRYRVKSLRAQGLYPRVSRRVASLLEVEATIRVGRWLASYNQCPRLYWDVVKSILLNRNVPSAQHALYRACFLKACKAYRSRGDPIRVAEECARNAGIDFEILKEVIHRARMA